MTETTHDPVHGARYAFAHDGDDLIVDTWLSPDGELPRHLHPRQEERWSVLDGAARVQVGDDWTLLRPADGEVVVAPGTPHALAGTGDGDGDAHLRCRVVPALDLEAFLAESAAAAREGLFTRGGLPRSLRGARWAARFLARHRDTVVMSSPPQLVQRIAVALVGRGAR